MGGSRSLPSRSGRLEWQNVHPVRIQPGCRSYQTDETCAYLMSRSWEYPAPCKFGLPSGWSWSSDDNNVRIQPHRRDLDVAQTFCSGSTISENKDGGQWWENSGSLLPEDPESHEWKGVPCGHWSGSHVYLQQKSQHREGSESPALWHTRPIHLEKWWHHDW